MRNVKRTLKKKAYIKKEIARRLTPEDTEKVWGQAHKILAQMYRGHEDLPKKVAAHTENYIFPAAAIYLSLKEVAPDVAYDVIKVTMKEISSRRGRTLARMTRIPGFKRLFLKMWGPISRKAFGPEAGFKNTFFPCKKGEFRMDITQCPYHKYLIELMCPEINPLFCDNDIYTYGNLPGLKFTRTQTIGSGGECCDFKLEII